MIKKIVTLLLLVVVFGASHLGYLISHRKVSPKEFRHPFILNRISNKAAPSDGALSILNQPFTYLDTGKRLTAFQSEDGAYVIKFFNPRKILESSPWQSLNHLKRPFLLKNIASLYFKPKNKIETLMERYDLGLADLQSETGLIYIHDSIEPKLQRVIHLIDHKGKNHHISLSDVPFVLQKKAEPLSTHLNHLILLGDQDKLKESLSDLFSLLAKRAEKGFEDAETPSPDQFGFSNGHLIQIDLRHLKKSTFSQSSLPSIFSHITQSLASLHPEVKPLCEEITTSHLMHQIPSRAL